MSITIHTDGSCQTQTRIGGYAAILQCGEHRREITGRAEDVTVSWIPRQQNSEADKLAQAARTNEPQADELPQPDCHLLIAGSRDATTEMLDYARRVVRRAHNKGYVIVVGDNPKGVDYAVVQECRRLQAKVIVCGIANYPRNGGCKHGEYIKVARDIYRAGKGRLFEAYHARDRYMADMSNIGIYLWNGWSKGTKAGADYMQSRNKEVHLKEFEDKRRV